ncbi:hypothetical protein BH11PLA1_BH11PLA1_20160 [soil metagenome]
MRGDLAARASAAARRNRPLWLIAIGGVLLVAAVIYALYGLALGAAAAASLASQSSKTAELAALVEQINQFKTDDAAGSDRYRVDTALASKLDTAARDVGLTMTIALNEEDKNRTVRNLGQRRLQVDAKGQTAEAILQFLQRAAADVPGLELAYVKLDPALVKNEQDQPTWNCTMKFTRWEQRSQ